MKSLDDLLPPEFVAQRKQKYEVSELKSNPNTRWDFLGQLMVYGGFDAVQAVLNDFITLEQAHTLLDGAIKTHRGHVYDYGVASFAAVRGGQKASEFNKMMKEYTKGVN